MGGPHEAGHDDIFLWLIVQISAGLFYLVGTGFSPR